MGLRMVLLGVCALTLSACGEKKAADSQTAPKAAEAQSAAPAQAQAQLPKRKAGLWTQTVSTAGTTQTSRLCLDEAVEAKISWWGAQASKDMCQETSVTPDGGGWRFRSSCDMGSGGRTTTTGLATGDFSKAYKVEAESVTEGAAAPQMNGPHKMSIDAAWQGPCPAGFKPGDIELPGGMKVNLLAVAG